MALPTQLKAARMTNDTLGVDIDNKVAEIEQALCDIFGFTIDTNVTESPFNCDNSGRITKALLRLKAAGPLGIRFYDSTVEAECRLTFNNGYFSVAKNTGTEAAPVWVNVYVLEVSTGVVTLSAIPLGPAADPTLDSQFARKAYVDGIGNAKVALSGDQTVNGVKTFGSFPVTPSSAPTTNYQTANKKYVDDNLQLKAWVNFLGADGTIQGSSGVSGVVKTAAGIYEVTFSIAFANANYAVSVICLDTLKKCSSDLLAMTNGVVTINTFLADTTADTDPLRVILIAAGVQ